LTLQPKIGCLRAWKASRIKGMDDGALERTGSDTEKP
jgi:hypothetical protein